MDAIADVVVGCDCRQQLLWEILGVRGCKPEPDVRETFGSVLQQVVEPIAWLIPQLISLRKPLSVLVLAVEPRIRGIVVAIHILPQQSDLPNPLYLQILNLF